MVSDGTDVGRVDPRPRPRRSDRGIAVASHEQWYLPGEARILIRRGNGIAGACIGRGAGMPLPPLAIAGPLGKPMRIVTEPGTSVTAIGLSAVEWSQLIGLSASAAANRIVGPDHLRGGEWVEDVADATDDVRSGRAVAERVRTIVATHLVASGPLREPLVAPLMAWIDAGRSAHAGGTATALGTSREMLGRVALRHFGFSTKSLLMRHRFLAAFARLQLVGLRAAAVEHGYTGVPHLLRDANLFLGTTPRRYIERTLRRG